MTKLSINNKAIRSFLWKANIKEYILLITVYVTFKKEIEKDILIISLLYLLIFNKYMK